MPSGNNLTAIKNRSLASNIPLAVAGLLARVALEPLTFTLKSHHQPRVRAVLKHNVYILLVRPITHPFTWDLPGGGYDHDESGEQCASRELREELRISTDPQRFRSLGKAVEQKRFRAWNYNCYSVDISNGSQTIRPNIELLQAAWFKQDSLPSQTMPYVRQLITNQPIAKQGLGD